jgi:hypothetical protein
MYTAMVSAIKTFSLILGNKIRNAERVVFNCSFRVINVPNKTCAFLNLVTFPVAFHGVKFEESGVVFCCQRSRCL